MDIQNIYKEAVWSDLKFLSDKGSLNISDLPRLTLKSLNAMAVDIYGKLQQSQVSFITETTSVDRENLLRLEILKDVIATKQAMNADARDSKERAARRQELLTVLQNKQSEELQGKSVAELKAMIDAL